MQLCVYVALASLDQGGSMRAWVKCTRNESGLFQLAQGSHLPADVPTSWKDLGVYLMKLCPGRVTVQGGFYIVNCDAVSEWHSLLDGLMHTYVEDVYLTRDLGEEDVTVEMVNDYRD